ncbi:CBL-interacting serine/threonine-protein kinase 26, partial [Capsicum annuum]
YLPFDDSNLMNLYNKITAAEFTCPPWISFGAIKLITCIFDPNPMILITVPEILVDEWFKKDYRPPIFDEIEDANLDDVEEVFKDSEEYHVTEKREEKPTSMNAFELISLSQGLNLGNLFDEQVTKYYETPKSKLEEKGTLTFPLRSFKLPLLFIWSRCGRQKETLWNSTSGKVCVHISGEIAEVAKEVHISSRSATSGVPMKLPGYDNVWLHNMPSDGASGPLSPMDARRSRDDNNPNDIL